MWMSLVLCVIWTHRSGPTSSCGSGLGMGIGQGTGGLESGRLSRLSPRQAVQAVRSLLVGYETSRIRSDGHLI